MSNRTRQKAAANQKRENDLAQQTLQKKFNANKRAVQEGQARDKCSFARVLRAGVAVTGGVAAVYFAFNHPEVVEEGIKRLNYDEISLKLMPYTQELSAALGGIVGYMALSLVEPKALYPIIKFLQGVKALLKLVRFLLVSTLKTPYYLFNALMRLGYEWRGTVCLLILAGIWARKNPEEAARLIQPVYEYVEPMVTPMVSSMKPVLQQGVALLSSAVSGLYNQTVG